ncbi:MAG: TRAP transporter small permease [Silicimonas sp.]
MTRTDQWLSRLEYALVVGAALSVFTMMLVTSVDVLMRYAFNSPLSWAYDLIVHYLLRTAFLFGFAWCLSAGHHICVDFFARFLNGRVYHLFQFVGAMLGAALFGFAAWFGAHETFSAWQNNDVFFGVVPWPAWLSDIVVPLGLAPLAMRCVHLAIANGLVAIDPANKPVLLGHPHQELEEERL